jgi:hypothetical protein
MGAGRGRDVRHAVELGQDGGEVVLGEPVQRLADHKQTVERARTLTWRVQLPLQPSRWAASATRRTSSGCCAAQSVGSSTPPGLASSSSRSARSRPAIKHHDRNGHALARCRSARRLGVGRPIQATRSLWRSRNCSAAW